MKKNLLLVVLALFIGIGGTYWYLEQKENSKEYEPLPEPGPEIIPTVVSITGKEIESGINNIGELNTAEYYFSRVEEVYSVKELDLSKIGIEWKFDIPLTGNTFVYKYDGEIKAGVDFAKVKVNKNDDTKEITIMSPKPEITNSNVDPDSYEFYLKDNNILNPIDPESFAVSFAQLIHDEETKAKESGLLDKAKNNAESFLVNFVKNAYGSSEYEIKLEFVED